MEEKVLNYLEIGKLLLKKAGFRNHRRFTLQCIKLGITPGRCKLKNPLNSRKSYHIIHKGEKQLVYKRVRNINKILCMYENQRLECYTKLRNLYQRPRPGYRRIHSPN